VTTDALELGIDIGEHRLHQLEGAPRVERLGEVSALRRLHARGAARLARALGHQPATAATPTALGYELAGPPPGLPPAALLRALHAAEHAQIAVLPLLAMCDRWDIGGLSTGAHPQTGGPTIFIYDGHPGGVGITRQGFAAFETLVADARRLIAECPCESGCPSCVQSPKCGNLNEPLHQRGALERMEARLAAGA
ncbi:MAG: Zn-binding domain-containing protein, partial [Solirubrobacterales bacterium]